MNIYNPNDIKLYHNENHIKKAILNNFPIESKLNVIMVISNPCNYKRRYLLANQFIERMINEKNVDLYIVELIYPDFNNQFVVTDKNNKNHLQLSTKVPIWHKENMINIAVEKLLPKDWKAFAWIDADVEFENADWALDTLKVLNVECDIVQIFSQCLDLDITNQTNNILSSFGYQFFKGYNYSRIGFNYWCPGFAWAINRNAYEKIGKLFEYGIVGSGDNIMAFSIIGNGLKTIDPNISQELKNKVLEFQKNASTLKLGYIPGVIRHHFHGSKKNRQYVERWQILLKYNYNPDLHLIKDDIGLLIPTKECPQEMLDDIVLYFKQRNEDDFY